MSSSVYVDPVSGMTVVDVISPKHGRFLTTINAEDAERVGQHTWALDSNKRRMKSGLFYFLTNVRKPDGKRTMIYLHRLLTTAPDGVLVDHKEPHNTLNSRQGNLRFATNVDNSRNQRPRTNGSSEYKGVWWDTRRSKWQSHIYINGKQRFLGYFVSEVEAAKAYDQAAAENFGEFTWLNRDHFPELTT